MSQIFENKLKELGIVLNDEQKRQFDSFYELLVEWNKVMNLTGIIEYEEVNEKHFVDSLSITKAIDMNCVDNLIDIGTGAGFPGIPLKIAFPHLKVVLLDSLNKRIKFLNTVIEELELIDIETIHGRAEDLQNRESIGNNLIFVYQEQWQTYPHFLSIACHISTLVECLSPTSLEKLRKR